MCVWGGGGEGGVKHVKMISCAATTPSPPVLTTSTSMSNDQPGQCDPLSAMISCNDIMTGVTPGDVKAMCK